MSSASDDRLTLSAIRGNLGLGDAPPALRAAVTAATRVPEPLCVPPLIDEARLPDHLAAGVAAQARRLVEALRSKGHRNLVEALVQEYALSSQEGIALMCLAEALLRIPDSGTRDAIIRDKLQLGNWLAHVHGPSLFVNAATWGLVITGKLMATRSDRSLAGELTRLLARGGEPLIRGALDIAIRLLGEHFVAGETIAAALAHGREMEARGYRMSYDMLGEAAMTAADAAAYFAAYARAIEAIGAAAACGTLHERPGISIKLSALHPRYGRSQRDRVMSELLPRLLNLAQQARDAGIGLNIDAEEADRLELSLDLLEALCTAPGMAGWDGIGFVIQAYQKRCPAVVDALVDLGRRTGHRLMVRLVKGAYWDSEIKRAQVDGLDGFPVFTRKIYTDVCYLACARRLLAAPDAIYPQFATHNAQTVAAILAIARGARGDWEFQCLHGMGEPLYDEIVGADKLDRPCRIYAPVGSHDTLLAYLVRRLLENGANSSFVHRVADPAVAIESLIADPVEAAARVDPPGAPHPDIALPRDLYPDGRRNSTGLDLADDSVLGTLADSLSGLEPLKPMPATSVDVALARAAAAAPAWAVTPASARAAHLRQAADLLQAHMPELIGRICSEAGRTLPDAVGEVREAIDFLRYYAGEATRWSPAAVPAHGVVACISPWNFPLAIFTGQVAAALASGRTVVAKPAEETPRVAARAIALLHAAGVPADALQLLRGDGEVGAALVADPRTTAVMFTGSTEVARSIQAVLARRLAPDGRPVPLIAETGGLNAMIVDSSALPEQVVADVLQSAFNSAGQRCSSLRLLCLQDDIADRVVAMVEGALAELRVGAPEVLATDVGPLITTPAQRTVLDHVARMRERGHRVVQASLPGGCVGGTYVPPTLIEISSVMDLTREVFGPVLHVMRYARQDLDALIAAINATGYALTFGLHTRIDETLAHVTARVAAGNAYVNRNVIGAVVGVQPFGGHGLSGTGPKAGGPLYLMRLRGRATSLPDGLEHQRSAADETGDAWIAWLRGTDAAMAETCAGLLASLPSHRDQLLAGPVGERNAYRLERRHAILCRPTTPDGLFRQLTLALTTADRVVLDAPAALVSVLRDLPRDIAGRIQPWTDRQPDVFDAALIEAEADDLIAANLELSARPGPIVTVWRALPSDVDAGAIPPALLMRERSLSTNTAAAGGNASLMALV